MADDTSTRYPLGYRVAGGGTIPQGVWRSASRLALLSNAVGIFRKSYAAVDVHRAQNLVEQGAVLLDVRSRPEWDAGHVPGATHLPLHEVIDHGIAVVAGRPVVVICRSGGRSANAARQLSRLGAETYLVRGGIDAWHRAGLAITPPD